MPTKLSRTSPTRGSIGPPLPSPPKTAPWASMASTTLASPTAERTNGTPCRPARSSDMRLLAQLVTIGPAPLPQHVVDAHGHRVLLAQVAARGVDHGQPVGVGILAEADVGPGLCHGGEHAGEVLGRRLGRVGELAVGLPAQDRHPAAQGFQQAAAQKATRPVVGVQQRGTAGRGSARLDRGQDGHQMRRGSGRRNAPAPSRSCGSQAITSRR